MKNQLLTPLREQIIKANEAYRKGNAIISDAEYDILIEELQLLNPDDELLNKVGHEVMDDERKQALPIGMWSMHKIKTVEEFNKWLNSKGISSDENLVIMPKLDGLSLCDKVQEKQAWTRGDGVFGQRSDQHYDLLQGRIETDLDIISYGEVIMPRQVFESKYSDAYENPRNLVSGLMNKKEANEKLKDCHYVRFGAHNHNFLKKSDLLDYLNTHSDIQLPYEVVSAAEITEDYLKDLFATWNTTYELDGLIIEVDDIELQNQIGRERNNNPAFARAYKGSFEQVEETTIQGVTWQISKQGFMKPVLHVDPVRLDGVTVSNVTGNNPRYMKRMGLGVGAVVKMIRSGMVIPKIIEVVKEGEVNLPTACECGGELSWNENQVELTCESPECTGQQLKRIISFFEILGVEQVSEGILKQFYDAGYDTLAKILQMSKEDMLAIDRFGERKVEITYNNIHSKLQGIEKSKLQHASGLFKNLGSKKLLLLEHFEQKPTAEEIIAIDGFSEISAASFLEGYDKFEAFLASLPISMKQTEKVESASNELEGKSFVFTKIRRKDLEEIIISKGGSIGSGVSKNTSYLVTGQKNGGTSKEKKANDLSIPVLTVEELENLLK